MLRMIGRNALMACLAGAALLSTGLSAQAQTVREAPLTQENGKFVLDAVGHTFTLPLPDWLTPAERLSGDLKPLLKIDYFDDDAQALLEIYPKGQDKDRWSTMFGARITLQPGRPLTDLREATIFGYSQTCKKELTGVFQFSKDEGDNLGTLGFVCGAYLDNLKGYAGQGEVMIMEFRQTAKGVAILYQEWRGKVFDPSDPTTWPVGAEALQARAAQLKTEAALIAAD
ncbi:hypothetical protein [Devosia sp.]|uniref:hypothetical protein n=1 Tax=Devosia sp. TaxID=1871048 RepID=UPI003267A804